MQQVTQFKQKAAASLDTSPDLPNRLNYFYCRFDKRNPNPGYRPPPPAGSLPLSPPFTILEHEVRGLLKKLNTRKASGPDGVSSFVTRTCAAQLAPIFTDIFNSSLQRCAVPQCFKSSVIVPVPKKTNGTQLNNYRPVALTSVVMKVFQRLVLSYLEKCSGSLRDAFQFAYQANRSVEDAVALGLHHTLQHLEYPGTYARLLFLDFSSAFNTIIPHKLFDNLLRLDVHPSVCYWILDFLLNRRQVVKVGNVYSGSRVLNTGAPQGCVLSPLLFTLFTNDCVLADPSVLVVKFGGWSHHRWGRARLSWRG